MKSFERPKEDTGISHTPTNVCGFFQQTISNSMPVYFVRKDEPSQMSTFCFRFDSINRNGSLDASPMINCPKAISLRIEALQKFREFGSNLDLKEKTEVPMLIVISCV